MHPRNCIVPSIKLFLLQSTTWFWLRYRRFHVSQDRHEIFLTVAKYDDDYVRYLEDKNYRSGTRSFMTMHQYGPWNTLDAAQMSALGPIMLAISLLADDEIRKRKSWSYQISSSRLGSSDRQSMKGICLKSDSIHVLTSKYLLCMSYKNLSIWECHVFRSLIEFPQLRGFGLNTLALSKSIGYFLCPIRQ